MAKLPFMRFYPGDYLLATRALTDTEKAIWMDLVCFMWLKPDERGWIEANINDLARMVGRERLTLQITLTSLVNKDICNYRELGNEVVRVESRRMMTEAKSLELNNKRQKRFNANFNARITPKKSEVRSQINPVVPFEDFYSLYPKRQDRASAEKAWASAFRDSSISKASWEQIVRPALLRQVASEDWKKEDGKFVPYPATWIRRKRWEDQLHPAPALSEVVG